MRLLPRIQLKRLLLLAGMTAGLLVALAIAVQPWHEQWLANHWRSKIAELPDDEAAVAVRQAAELGEPGLEVVAEALGSFRVRVAREAERLLVAEVERLETLPTSQASPRLAAMARALARSVPSYGPTARALAFQMTERMLRTPVDVTLIDNAAYLADCDQVIQAAGRSRGKADTIARATGSLEDALAVGTEISSASEDSAVELFRNSDLAGGGIPVEPVGVPKLPVGPAEDFPGQPSQAAEVVPNAREPRLIVAPQDTQPTVPRSVIELPPPPPERLIKPPRVQRIPLQEDQTATTRRTSSTRMDELHRLEILPLMRELHNPDLDVAAAVAAELRKRGLRRVHLQYARALTGNDPKARLALVDSLPGSLGIDVGQWLMWLSKDRDAQVRLAALSVLLTSNDRKLLQQAQEIARQDSDPRVVELGQRSLQSSRRPLR